MTKSQIAECAAFVLGVVTTGKESNVDWIKYLGVIVGISNRNFKRGLKTVSRNEQPETMECGGFIVGVVTTRKEDNKDWINHWELMLTFHSHELHLAFLTYADESVHASVYSGNVS